MYAAHFAAALAINCASPRVPLAAAVTAVFLPDLLWLGLSLSGLEPVGSGVFFDGWSHSMASIAAEAVGVGLLTLPLGRAVSLALFAAVLSHLPLDIPIHPRPIELYPHSAWCFPLLDTTWGRQPGLFGQSHFWWVETGLVVMLLAVYAWLAPRTKTPPNVIIASAILVLWLQIAFG
jgi:hypothetical protein